MKFFSKLCLWVLAVSVLLSCKQQEEVGSNPYGDYKNELGIAFTSKFPTPEIAEPGDLVDFDVKGIKPYINELDFFINNVKVDVVEAYDTLITVKIPAFLSSGEAKIVVNNQVFYGPRLNIAGKVAMDENFGTANGYNGSVTDILPISGGYIVTGYFTNFNNEAVLEGNNKKYRNGIHHITNDGKSASNLKFADQRGALGISSIDQMSNGGYVVGGAIGSYNNRAVRGLTRLNSDGTLDTTIVMVINTTENARDGFDTVATFNGGVEGGGIMRVFGVADNKVIAVGSFTRYVRIDYDYSSRDTRKYIYKNVRTIARFNEDGSLDESYAVDNSGANGPVYDAVKVDAEKIVLVGRFTTFNGKPAPGIVRLNADGSVDATFNVGTGAVQIGRVTYNSNLKKYALVGNFQTFNAVAANNMVLLNADGTVDSKFKLGDIGSELPTYAKVLNNGRVLVAGTFDSYNGVNRSRLLLLEADGSLQQSLNSASPFVGSVFKALETTSSSGESALLIGGYVSQFGVKKIGNLFKMEITE